MMHNVWFQLNKACNTVVEEVAKKIQYTFPAAAIIAKTLVELTAGKKKRSASSMREYVASNILLTTYM